MNNEHSIRGMHRFRYEAMATTFEVIIAGDDRCYAEQAAWAAFDELDRLEAQLSRFIENSDISQINNLTAGKSLQVSPAVFECLQLSIRMHNQTDGAFDITLGVGIDHIELDDSRYTVHLTGPVRIDLGGIGKGYAVDKMAQLLREWSIETALISAGYSSVLALDAPADTKGWPLTLSNPNNSKQILVHLNLQNLAVSGSGLQKGSHIIDPHTSVAVEHTSAAWVSVADAATADALSTAFMVMSPNQVEQYRASHPDISAMLVDATGEVMRFGPW